MTGQQLGSPVITATAGAGRLYLALANGQLAVVDTTVLGRAANTPDAGLAVRTYPAHGTGPTSAVAISPDGKLLATGGDDRRVILWDIHDGVPQARPALIGHSEEIRALAFSPDSAELASSAEDSTVIRWNVRLGERIGEPVYLPSIADLAYIPGDAPTLVVGSSGVSRWPLAPNRWLEVACQVLGGRTFSEVERRQILGATTPTVRCPSR
jgi:WD40 repeat protein